jgi:hypothetical protein
LLGLQTVEDISDYTALAPGSAVVAMFNITGTVILLYEEANWINFYICSDIQVETFIGHPSSIHSSLRM